MLHKILYAQLFKQLITCINGKYSSPSDKIESLLHILELDGDVFWNYHYTLSEATHRKHSLLGDARKYDLLVNTVIPIAVLYARIFGVREVHEHGLNIARELPLLETNSILVTMEKQLLKGKMKMQFAFQQQGVLHLYKRYCVVERCNECLLKK